MTSLRQKFASKLSLSSAPSPSSTPGTSTPTSETNNNDPSRKHSTSSSSDDPLSAEKYLLRVTAGPSYDSSTHSIVNVNTNAPTIISNKYLTAAIHVRIRDYAGLPRNSPKSSTYFEDSTRENDAYSISFSFIPKEDLPTRSLVWGNDFDRPIRDRLPPGFNTAFRIVKEFIDPGLSCDAYADQPWLYGPCLGCWFDFRVGGKVDVPEGQWERWLRGRQECEGQKKDVLVEGADGDGEEIRKKLGLPGDASKRRKWALKEENRESMCFEKGVLYQGDFHNPYIEFNKFALKLPGFSISVIKYINDKTHHLRYVFKNRDTGELYFCVVFTLLFGEEMKAAIEESDRKEQDEGVD